MERAIIPLFQPAILHEAAKRFGMNTEKLHNLHGFQNFVFESFGQNKPLILRIAHQSHRSAEMVEGELEWVNYLYEHGIPCAKPVASLAGRFIEVIEISNSYFVACAFEKLEGHIPPSYEENPVLYQEVGKITGKIHALSKNYQPSSLLHTRYEWHDNNYLRRVKDYVPIELELVHTRFENLLQDIQSLPRNKNAYGLIHGDISLGNFLVKQGKVSIIDFDECEYGWYMSDIAIALFYATPLPNWREEAKRLEVARHFYENFMEGYSSENSLEAYQLKYLPLLLKLREMLLFSAIYRSLHPDLMDDWTKDYIHFAKENIEQGYPYISL